MQHLERLDNIAFGTVMLSFLFHILAISLNHWKENVCSGCESEDPLATWYTSIRQRCYESSMVSIFFDNDHSALTSLYSSFITEVCIPNKYLMAKTRANGLDCLMTAMNASDTVCALGTYNKEHCYCDYTANTKVILAFSIVTSFSLGIMIFLAHFQTVIKHDYILRWLRLVSLSLLSLSILCILVVLITAGIAINEDVNELRYSSSLVESAVNNVTELDYWRERINSRTETSYKVKIGSGFGLEILAAYFATVSLTIYAVLYNAKKRSHSKKQLRST